MAFAALLWPSGRWLLISSTDLRTIDLLNWLLWPKAKEINDLVACAIRLGKAEFLTSCSICSSSRILCLHLCSVSSHSCEARFSFLRQCNNDASVICHFSDVSRAASNLMCANSSLSMFSSVFDFCFSSCLLMRSDTIWLTASWTTAELTISAIRIQASIASLPCSGNAVYKSVSVYTQETKYMDF